MAATLSQLGGVQLAELGVDGGLVRLLIDAQYLVEVRLRSLDLDGRDRDQRDDRQPDTLLLTPRPQADSKQVKSGPSYYVVSSKSKHIPEMGQYLSV